jgi:hypothetical protein
MLDWLPLLVSGGIWTINNTLPAPIDSQYGLMNISLNAAVLQIYSQDGQRPLFGLIVALTV